MRNIMAKKGEIYRIVLDSNVIFSGIYTKTGNPGTILDLVAKGEVILILSEFIIDEVFNTLSRHQMSESIIWFRTFISQASIEIIQIPSEPQVEQNLHLVPRDPKDVVIVLTAINAEADYLISGDSDLNSHNESTKEIDALINVLTPKDFISLFRKNKQEHQITE